MAQYQPEQQDELDEAIASIPGEVGGFVAEQEVAMEAARQQGDVLQMPNQGMQGGMHREQIPEIDAMDESELVAIVRTELDRSLDGVDAELAGNWRLALKYYQGKEPEQLDKAGCIDDEKGTADATSRDVADVIEATMAQIMPSFEGDAIFRFGAIGDSAEELKADEQRAEQESEAVNWTLMSRNNGYIGLQSLFRDALLMRMGIMKVATEEQTTVQSTEYEGLQPIEIAMLSAEPNTRIMQSGDKIVANRYNTERRVVVDPIPPEELKITGSWRSPFLDGIPFIAHHRIVRRGELIEMGYPPEIVETLPTESGETNQVTVERSIVPSEDQWFDEIPGNEPVRLSECYIRVDYDGDGFSEQRKVVLGGHDTLLENAPVHEQPFTMSVPILRSHRATGFSLFDRERDVQDVKTETLRQQIDNLRWCNMPDIDMVQSQANEADVLARRPGGVNRMTTPGAITRNMPLPVGDDALNFLGYMDKVRSERGGASLDLQSAQLQVAGDSAHGVERQVSSREMMATFLASTMVHTGVVPMVRKIHQEMRMNGGGQLSARSIGSGKAVVTNPDQWPEREEVYLVNAVTLGDRMRRQQALQGIIAGQQQMLERGQSGILTDLSGVYHAVVDAAKNANLVNPEQYFVDPQSQQAQQTMQQMQQQQAQQQAQQQQAQQMQIQQQSQLLLQLEQIKAQAAQQREQIQFMSDRMKVAEDARQANQQTMVDLTKAELQHGQNVPGAAV